MGPISVFVNAVEVVVDMEAQPASAELRWESGMAVTLPFHVLYHNFARPPGILEFEGPGKATPAVVFTLPAEAPVFVRIAPWGKPEYLWYVLHLAGLTRDGAVPYTAGLEKVLQNIATPRDLAEFLEWFYTDPSWTIRFSRPEAPRRLHIVAAEAAAN